MVHHVSLVLIIHGSSVGLSSPIAEPPSIATCNYCAIDVLKGTACPPEL